jgi:hypothetical protein
MGFRYAVIDSGRQGVSAAYDLARFGECDYSHFFAGSMSSVV